LDPCRWLRLWNMAVKRHRSASLFEAFAGRLINRASYVRGLASLVVGFALLVALSPQPSPADLHLTSAPASALPAREIAGSASQWMLQSTPNMQGPQGWLDSVSCAGSAFCVAVGHYYDVSELPTALAEEWNGKVWSVQGSPTILEASSSELNGVSCISSRFCVAVGTYTKDKKGLTLAEIWNGLTWTVQPTPNPAKSPLSNLESVSCTSTTNCLAVGSTYEKPPCFDCTPPITTLAELWTDGAWKLTAPIAPKAENSYLFSVSCISADACYAVGYYEPTFGTDLNLAEFWNGTAWSDQDIPPSATDFSQLYSVSCTTIDSCTAVGTSKNSSDVYSTFAERWGGSKWAIEATPDPTNADGSVLYAVSCASAQQCVAVGEWSMPPDGHPNVPFALYWDGTKWHLSTTSLPPGPVIYSGLQGVSCVSSADCIATGYYQSSSGFISTIAESWNGTGWSLEKAAEVGEVPSYLYGVSCRTGSPCMAVGYFTDGAGGTRALAELRTSGTWTIVVTPNASEGDDTSSLVSVWCSNQQNCLAVGDYQSRAGSYRTLVEAWNGKSWSIQTTPNPAGASDSYLDYISCTSPTACIAVGYYSTAAFASLAFSETWNGKSWSVAATPRISGASYTLFNGVSCTSSASCIAIGDTGKSVAKPRPLAERWNGKSWVVESTQVPKSSIGSTLYSVSCTQATACIAVGVAETKSHDYVTLAEGWNGQTWQLQEAADAQDFPVNVLNSISCTSGSSCVAVGYAINTSEIAVTLGEFWNGSEWSIQQTPNPKQRLEVGTGSGLWGVSCTASDECNAVGYSTNDTFVSTPLDETVKESHHRGP
jgi:hypothetical protein